MIHQIWLWTGCNTVFVIKLNVVGPQTLNSGTSNSQQKIRQEALEVVALEVEEALAVVAALEVAVALEVVLALAVVALLLLQTLQLALLLSVQTPITMPISCQEHYIKWTRALTLSSNN